MIARRSQEFKKPIRWFSIPTCYRYERPQRGRKREFKQINFDILGDDGLYGDLEMFNIIIDILTELGATPEQFQIYYNNRRFIDAVCQLLLEIPKERMPVVYNVLDKSGKMEEDEFEKYVIDTFQKEWIIQGIYKLKEADDLDELMNKFDNVPEDFYKSKGYKELKKLENLINKTGVSDYCSFSSAVVRGLDYYTGTVFEVFDTGQENRRAITGGGRYDDLLTLFSDEELSGIGFGMGVLTLKLFLETYDLLPKNLGETKFSHTVYITCVNEKVDSYAFKMANIIREADIPCIVDFSFEGLGNQLSKANDLNIPVCLILGPNEMEQERVTIKNMRDESQKTVKKDAVLNELKSIFNKIS
jgi:histidyl-tRNA synthetase